MRTSSSSTSMLSSDSAVPCSSPSSAVVSSGCLSAQTCSSYVSSDVNRLGIGLAKPELRADSRPSFAGERVDDDTFFKVPSHMPGLQETPPACIQSQATSLAQVALTQLNINRFPAQMIPSNSTVSCGAEERSIDILKDATGCSAHVIASQPYPSSPSDLDGNSFILEGKSLVVLNSKANDTSRSSVTDYETGLHPLNSPTSDEDQYVIGDRKQRRMLSNRESARRSRQRKQQHLEELRAHVTQLRAENSQMMGRFNLASQHYTQLNEENMVLKSQARELSIQLQRLHHTVASRFPNSVQTLGLDSGNLPQNPSVRVEARHLPSLSQPVTSTAQ